MFYDLTSSVIYDVSGAQEKLALSLVVVVGDLSGFLTLDYSLIKDYFVL